MNFRKPFQLRRLVALAGTALLGAATLAAAADVPAISVGNSTLVRPATATEAMEFNVTRSGDTSYPVTVGYRTRDDTAKVGVDYNATRGVVTIPEGLISGTIQVPILPGISSTSKDLEVELIRARGPLEPDRSRLTLDAGDGPSITADFNGDGKADLAIANGSSVAVLLNDSRGGGSAAGFAARTDIDVKPNDFFSGIVSADFNGDGKSDLAVSGLRAVTILINNTARGAEKAVFAVDGTLPTLGSAVIVTADFNTDGKSDIATLDGSIGSGNGVVSVYLNETPTGRSTPSFGVPTKLPAKNQPISMIGADLNDDGRPDLAVISGNEFIVGVLSVALNVTSSGAASVSFLAAAEFPTGRGPTSIVAADFNREGTKVDLAVANDSASFFEEDDTVLVFENFTVGNELEARFIPRPHLNLVVGSDPRQIRGDIDGDNRIDLITVNGGSNDISVLRNASSPNTGNIFFGRARNFSSGGGEPYAVSVSDFNGDRRLDLAVSNRNSAPDGALAILLNTPDKLFAAPGTPVRTDIRTGDDPQSVALADFNRDGRLDVVLTEQSGSIPILLNTIAAGASFPAFVRLDPIAGDFPGAAFVADFNSDKRPDLVVSNDRSQSISILSNRTPDGTFAAAFEAPMDVSSGPMWLVGVADFNGDGKPDIASSNSPGPFSTAFAVQLNTTPDGQFTPMFSDRRVLLTSLESPWLTDLNADGRADLAFNEGAPFGGCCSLSVRLNTTKRGDALPSFGASVFVSTTSDSELAAGDFNGDGRQDLATGREVIINNGPNSAGEISFARHELVSGEFGVLATADIDGDGRLDLTQANPLGLVSVVLNDTGPSGSPPRFLPAVEFFVGSGNRFFAPSIASGDLNNDGVAELLLTNSGNDSLSVLVFPFRPAELSKTVGVGTILPSRDTRPDPYRFTDRVGVGRGTTQTSNAIVVSGIDAPASIRVSGGSYSINNSGFSNTPRAVRNGDRVRLQHTSAQEFGTSVNTRVVIGGVADTFTTTTLRR